MPQAFKFKRPRRKNCKGLGQRYLKIQTLRARQLRIAPKVNCPHIHPPTLASQLSERFRERTQMEHRFEVLGHQLEVFETTYNQCAQRTSDAIHARTSHWLEWAIIILLVVQVILYAIEFAGLQNRFLDWLPFNL